MPKSKKESTSSVLYIVRHGETEWNVKGKMQGHEDSPLTELGITQAKTLGQELAHVHFDAVFSSDLLRAKRTAQLITLEKNLAIGTTAALRERKFGQHEGKTYQQLKKLFDVYDDYSDTEKFKQKLDSDVESDEELVARFITFLREVSVAYSGKTILIVTHGGVMRALIIHLGFATYRELRHGAITNTAYVKLKSDGIDFFIEGTNGIMKREV